MKLIKNASGKQAIKMSKSEWNDIGVKAGWIKEAGSLDELKQAYKMLSSAASILSKSTTPAGQQWNATIRQVITSMDPVINQSQQTAAPQNEFQRRQQMTPQQQQSEYSQNQAEIAANRAKNPNAPTRPGV